ncbi:thioesterase family protein [Rhodoferax sp.]|uniref:thioesterase family protein n=1 Tax=Rhodoferax sp. TaxID=50421 RepID=UPI0025DA4378|nr:thioesterase family protein [Rhodoferax sp.]
MASDPLYTTVVPPEWVDYNGHLRDAYYGLICSYATDALMDQIGLDAAGRACTHGSLFTLESHIHYLHEVKLGAQVQVQLQLLGCDAKRLHIFLRLVLSGRAEPVAVCEQMLLHVDIRGPRSAVFPTDVLARVQGMAAAHRALPVPALVGRVMQLPGALPS